MDSNELTEKQKAQIAYYIALDIAGMGPVSIKHAIAYAKEQGPNCSDYLRSVFAIECINQMIADGAACIYDIDGTIDSGGAMQDYIAKIKPDYLAAISC